MSEIAEPIIGSVQVSTRLGSGIEHLNIFFTPSRMVIAHIGKRGVSGLKGMSLLGKLGEGLGSLFRSSGEARKRRKVERDGENVSLGEILKMDKDNFEVRYDDVVRVEIDDNPVLVGIMVLTKYDKFEFFTERSIASVSKLLKDALNEKFQAT